MQNFRATQTQTHFQRKVGDLESLRNTPDIWMKTALPLPCYQTMIKYAFNDRGPTGHLPPEDSPFLKTAIAYATTQSKVHLVDGN